MIRPNLARPIARLALLLAATAGGAEAIAQDTLRVHPADRAFEQGQWSAAIAEYRALLEEDPADRLSALRIAMALRELGRHTEALDMLDEAKAAEAPAAMVELERARNLLALDQPGDALDALYEADHLNLRALSLLEESPDFDAIRDDQRFRRVLRSVRSRANPCTEVPEAAQFDFWLGRWEVRSPTGALLGYNTIEKRDGDCALFEDWRATSGSTGTSLTFFVPSREQWRHIWTGSGGALVDVVGGLRDDGAVHMEGTVEYHFPANVVAFRATWTPGANGVVRQRMEEFDVVTGTWREWFDGFFHKLDAGAAETSRLR